jgi:PAS domain S-box-containing protein
MVMTLAEEPYTIVQVNKLWEDMTGYKAEEVVGKTSVRILEGKETEVAAVEGLMNEIRFKRPASAMVVRYKKSGERYRDFFLAYPLSTDSRITHYLALSSHIEASHFNGCTPQQNSQGISQSPGSVVTAEHLPQLAQTGQEQQSSTFFGITTAGALGQTMVAGGSQPMFSTQANLSNPLVASRVAFATLGGATSGAKRLSSSNESGTASKQSKSSVAVPNTN